MTVKKIVRTYYYCTECDKEWGNEKQGLITCSIHKDRTGCDDCMFKCISRFDKDTLSGIQGCDMYFCKECMDSTPNDRIYPGLLCKNCIKKYNLEKYYGESGIQLNEEMDEMQDTGIPIDEVYKKFFPPELVEKLLLE